LCLITNDKENEVQVRKDKKRTK